MAWSYGADPMGDPIDEVHFLVGDTNAADPLLQDDEIEHLLSVYPKIEGKAAYLAGAAAADAIAAKFARKMSASVGPLSQQAQQQWEHYVALAAQLRVLYNTNGLGVVGLSQTARVLAVSPVLGGGGPTILGNNTLPVGGAT